MGNIELIDQDYSNVSNAGRIHSNLIRLKKTSFAEVSKKYSDFRGTSVTNEVNNEVASDVSSVVVPNETVVESKVMDRLGDKIEVISKDEVPTNFAGNRAIKLRTEMNTNLRKNSNDVYTVGEEKEVTVANEEYGDYGFTDFANTDFTLAAAANTENRGAIDRNAIADAINEKFDEINDVTDNKEEEIEKDNSPTDDLSKLFSEETGEVVSDELSEENPFENAVFDDEISRALDDGSSIDENGFDDAGNYSVESSLEKNNFDSGVSHDAGSSFDEYGFNKEGIFETGESNANGFDATGVVRDNIVIAPDRDKAKENVNEYTVENETQEGAHFDFSDATAKDLNKAVSIVTSEQDLRAMLARAAELNAARAKTKAELEEAKKVKADEEQKVLEAKRITEEKEAKRIERIKLLQDYIKASNQDYEFNVQAIQATRAETENNRRMVEEEKMKGRKIDEVISEIEATMRPFIEDDANNPQHIRVI